MTRRLCALLIAASLVVALLVTPGIAAAAGTMAAQSPAIEVQLWPSETEGALLLVSAEVPQGADLPYEMRLPLPAGADVAWVGEITGGGAETDVERAHTLQDGAGGKVVVFTLTKARLGQYEATLPALSEQAGRFASTLEWVQSVAAGTVSFAVKFSATAGDVRTEPQANGAAQVNGANERLYTLPTQTLGRGQRSTLTASFVRVPAQVTGTTGTAPASVSTGGSASALLAVLGGLLVVAMVVLVWLILRAHRARRGPGETGEPAPGDADARFEDADRPQGSARQETLLSDEPFDLD